MSAVLDEQLIIKSCKGEKLEEVKILNLSDLRISSISEGAFDKLINLEELNLSKNELRTFGQQFSKLYSLNKLDLHQNSLSKPVNYMANLPAIKHLNLDANPLEQKEKNLVIDLVPSLTHLDGQNCLELRKNILDLEKQVKRSLELEWLEGDHASEFRSAFTESAGDESATNLEHLTFHYLAVCKKKIKTSPSMLLVLSHKVDSYGKAKVEEELARIKTTVQRKFGNLSTTCNIDDTGSGDSPSITGSPAKRKSSSVKDKSKKQKQNLDKPRDDIDYDPTIFIRAHCHLNNEFDSGTQIWKVAFRPKLKSDDKEVYEVASCGGNRICLIDCATAKVIKRYTDEDPTENFYALAWTVMDDVGKEEAVIASAGHGQHIVLISLDEEFGCYFKFKAHDKDINALLFHPTRTHWLMSGSYDMKIKLWNIQRSSHSKHDFAPLTELATGNLVLTLAFSTLFNTLFIGGEHGLSVWKNVSNDVEQGTMGHTFPKTAVIDGVSVIPEQPNYVAVKLSRSGKIFIASIDSLLQAMNKSTSRSSLNQYREFPFPSSVHLQFKTTENDYQYLAVKEGLLACGDDTGSLHLYNTKKLDFSLGENLNSDKLVPPSCILEWPAISNPKGKKGNKKIVDETREKIINAVSISDDLTYVVAATSINLICIWKRS